jgi:hypothetical protein
MNSDKHLIKPSLPINLLILFRPTQAAIQIKEKPTFRLPMIVLSLFIMVILAFMGYYMFYIDPTIQEPGVSVQEVAIFYSVFMGIFGLFIAPIAILVATFIIWLVLRLFNESVAWRILLSFTCYLFIFIILDIASFLLNIIITQEINLDSPFVTGLAYWLPSSGILTPILNQIKLTLIWQTIITFFALRQLASLTNRKALWVTSVITIIIILLSIALY